MISVTNNNLILFFIKHVTKSFECFTLTYLAFVAFSVGLNFASTYCKIISMLFEASGEYFPGRKIAFN